MKLAIIINSERLSPDLKTQLDSPELFDKYNFTFDLFIVSCEEIIELVQGLNILEYNAILVGGGDGTVRSVVQSLIDKDVPLAILPLGTFNNLAKTIGFPNNLDEVLQIIKSNKTKQIDVGKVNNEIFINHCWIGFYSYILKLRKKHKNVIGKSKLLKLLFATWNLFTVLPIYHLTLKVDNISYNFRTCLIYISNNDHSVDLFSFGDRKTLSLGMLSVNILNVKNRWELFLSALSILFNRFENSKYLQQFNTDNLTLTADAKLINTVIDGELYP